MGFIVLIQDRFRNCLMPLIFLGSPDGLLTSQTLALGIDKSMRSCREPDNRCEIVLKGKKGRYLLPH
jgi:hypothetical protein